MDKPGVTAALQACATTFQVTLLRSRETEQVLFLEAGKDFVDTLFSFLVLPMGTIINILSQGTNAEIQVNSLGGISCIFKSLDSSFMYVDKNELLQCRPSVVGCTCQPRTSVPFQQDLVTAELMPPSHYLSSSPIKIYRCDGYCGLYSQNYGTRCEDCCKKYSTGHYSYKNGPYSGQKLNPTMTTDGFVNNHMKFIVTDKLEIIPSSINASVSLLEKLDLTSVKDTERNEITVNITQIVELLHSALVSKNCLNDVFRKE